MDLLKYFATGIVTTPRSRRLAFVLIASLVAIATSAVPAQGASLGYYPFDADTNDHDQVGTANNLVLTGSPLPALTTGSGGMFGEAMSFAAGNGVAQVGDTEAVDFDTNFANFSVEFWMKPDSWTDTTALRLITGKSTGSSSQRGWLLQKTNVAINQLQFVFWQSAAGSPQFSATTAFTEAPSSTDYMHVAATYATGGTGNVNLYINGIGVTPVTSTATALNGANSGDFEIGNRGSQATVNQYIGLVDDYGIASDTFSAQQIAITHGLGRLAGVSLNAQNQAMTSTQILDVLNAYNTQGSAAAGGKTWSYSANLNQGTTVGTIGGTVAGNNAFIVLGVDGSGVKIAIPAHPGDFDGDGDVDGADFVAWQTNFPKPSGAILAEGDADGDGDVDGADFVVWQTNFPFTPGPGAAPVPEPGAIVLAGFAAAAMALGVRRRRN
jgi:hypothetical protein